MEYKKIIPHKDLEHLIHFYWELHGNGTDTQLERVYPDGCAGVVMNLGSTCLTDNGSHALVFGKTYVVGAMTSFKDSYIDHDTHLLGVCFKPATFCNFYSYDPQEALINETVAFGASDSFRVEHVLDNPYQYLDQFFLRRMKSGTNRLQPVLGDIHSANGQLVIRELSSRHFTTPRQLERDFRKFIGLSPKAYSSIIRFQHALRLIKTSNPKRSLMDIAFDCGYYDHSHLSNEIKRITGLAPSLL